MALENRPPQKTLVAFATGWGAEYGGINVFNTEFLQRLAFATQNSVRVVCVVPDASPTKIRLAHAGGVQLIPLSHPPAELRLDESHAEAALEALRSHGVAYTSSQIVWLGHDRFTGGIALRSRDIAGGRAALIHHMSYAHYEAYAENALSANEKFIVQKELFKRADLLFAIGPLLRDALHDMVVDANVLMLVPGLDEVTTHPPPKTFTAFMSGRLTPDTAKIKQSHLGVAAFAEAHRRADADAGLPDALRKEPRLILRGAYLEAADRPRHNADTGEWIKFAESYAGRVITILALPYTTERVSLLEDLARSSVSLMPSWHEGFGLAGWEAVAAGVPLILSKKSGLYQLLDEESHGAWVNWVYSVDVLGRVDEPYFREEDLKSVSDRVIEVAKSPAIARDKAARLREALLSRFSWNDCVDSALLGIGWLDARFGRSTPWKLTEAQQVQIEPPSIEGRGSPLIIPRSLWKFGSGFADSQLLRAEEEAVPFDVAREPDLTLLSNWAVDPEFRHALRLITGSGGTGKTRLALEMCNRLGMEGWYCGFLPSEVGTNQASGAWALIAQRSEPVLVVVDYAETRQEMLLALVRAMLESDREFHVRILLLARDGSEWWERLPMRDPLCEPFLSGHATSGPFILPPLHNDLSQRAAAYTSAVNIYAHRLGLTEIPHLELDLSGDHFGRPLFVQMAALLALFGERPASAEGLTKALLHHERRYWARLLKDRTETAAVRIDDRYAVELMTIATLAGGFNRFKDGEEAWRRWTDSLGSTLDRAYQRVLFELLASLYPGERGLQPLRPDLLGEELVAHSLLQEKGAGLLDIFLAASSSSVRRRSALTIVGRLADHRPDVGATVIQSFVRNFMPCAVDLLHVCTQTESRSLVRWAEEAFALLPTPVRNQAVGLLNPLFQYESVQLADLACAVSRAEVEAIRAKLDKKPSDVKLQANYVRVLNNHALDLERAGRDAEVVAKQGLDAAKRLAMKHRNQFNITLARAQASYAAHLAKNGRVDEAMPYAHASLELYETVGTTNSDQHEAEYAGALGNYAGFLMATGQSERALPYSQKALAVYRRLAAQKPDQFHPDLAAAIGNYAQILSDIGQEAEALTYHHEATTLYEKLVVSNPDRFEPDVAQSLLSYSSFLTANDRNSESYLFTEKALDIARKLYTKNPDRFRALWASCLGAYSVDLASRGRYDEALAQSTSSIALFRELVDRNPERYEREWALRLRFHPIRLTEVGRYDDALLAARDSQVITLRLAAKYPLRFADALYLNTFALQWVEYLAGRGSASIHLWSVPGTLHVKPSAVSVGAAYQAWLRACYATDHSERAEAIAEVLGTEARSHVGQFRQVEPYWICAGAWALTHSAAALDASAWHIQWQNFLASRAGRLPSWMNDIANRLQFDWPAPRM